MPPTPLPIAVSSLVASYRVLLTEYKLVTDPVLAASYKVVLDAKYIAITNALATYNLAVSIAISALAV